MLFTRIVVSIILFMLLETGLIGGPVTRALGNFASDGHKDLWWISTGRQRYHCGLKNMRNDCRE
jgi:hypothetical protein